VTILNLQMEEVTALETGKKLKIVLVLVQLKVAKLDGLHSMGNVTSPFLRRKLGMRQRMNV